MSNADEVHSNSNEEKNAGVAYAVQALSFADYEDGLAVAQKNNDLAQLFNTFQAIAENIMYTDADDKTGRMEKLVYDFSSRINMVKEMSESGDTSDSGNIEEKELEAEDSSEIESRTFRNRVKSALISLGLVKENKEKATQGVTIWKEVSESGKETYYWVARYSNNFRDRDNPPEIISESSHKDFVDRVDKGEAPLPELWLWHQPEWRIGKSTWVAYDDSGFAISGGYFYDHAKEIAEFLLKAKDVLVSHGMPYGSIERDVEDKSIITRHDTTEISPLPASRAANELTGFVVLSEPLKEHDMAIPKNKREELVGQWGIAPEMLDKIEAVNAEQSKAARNNGVESKEVSEEKKEETIEVANETVDAVNTEEETAHNENEEDALTVEAVAEAIKAIVEPLVKSVADLTERLAVVEAAKEKQTSMLSDMMTPSASQAARIVGGVLGFSSKQMDEEDDVVDGRTSLAKSKPKEAEKQVEGPSQYPFINQIIGGK